LTSFFNFKALKKIPFGDGFEKTECKKNAFVHQQKGLVLSAIYWNNIY
jgi:hypothetical protein